MMLCLNLKKKPLNPYSKISNKNKWRKTFTKVLKRLLDINIPEKIQTAPEAGIKRDKKQPCLQSLRRLNLENVSQIMLIYQ